MQNLELLYSLSGLGIISFLVFLVFFAQLIIKRKDPVNNIVINYIIIGIISCAIFGLLHNILSQPDFFKALIQRDFSNPKISAYAISWSYRSAIYFTVFSIWLKILLKRAQKTQKKKSIFTMLYIHAALISTAWFTDFEKLLYYNGTIDVHHITHWIGGIIGCSMLILLEYIFMEKKIIDFLNIKENYQKIRNKLLVVSFGMSGLLMLSSFGIVIGCLDIDPPAIFLEKLFGYCFLLLIPLLFIILRITSVFQKNLYRAVKALQQAGNQDFTYSIDIDSRDEFGELAASLKDLKQNFHKVIEKVRQSVGDVTSSAQSMNQLLNELVQRISRFFSHQAEITAQQVQKTIQAQEDVGGILEIIEAITEELSEQSGVISRTTGLIKEMKFSLNDITNRTEMADNQAQELYNIAGKGKDMLFSTLQSIQTVASKSSTIQDLSVIISEISEKIGLVAINTGIEAAHMGNAGSGFKVIAQELSNLATHSSENVKIISGHLGDIALSVKESLSRMEASRDGFLTIHNQSESSQELNSVIHQAMIKENNNLVEISSISNRLLEITGSINHFSDQLAQSSGLIHEVLGEFQKKASEDERSFYENSAGLNSQIKKMMSAVASNIKIAKELDSEIAGFKI